MKLERTLQKSRAVIPALVCTLALLVGSGGPAHGVTTDWEENDQSKVRLIAPYKSVPAAGEITLGLEITMIPKWHVYWKNPGDAGFPPVFDFDGSEVVTDHEILFPAPEKYDIPGGLVAYGYSERIIYPVRVSYDATSLEGETVTIAGNMLYLICEESCLPYDYDLSLDIPISEAEVVNTELQQQIDPFLAQVPREASAIDGFATDAWFDRSAETLEVTLTGSLPDGAGPWLFIEGQDAYKWGAVQRAVTDDGLRFTVPYEVTDPANTPEQLELAWTITDLGTDEAPLAIEARRIVTGRGAAAAPDVAIAGTTSGGPGKPLTALGIAAMIGVGLLGGLLLNVMPCVLPVLSLKVFGLMKSAGGDRSGITRFGVGTTSGIVFSFWCLAGAAVLPRYGGRAVGWGVQFQEPTFVTFLALVILLFSLNLWGVFEINLPSFLAGRISPGPGQQQGSFVSHFTSGLFATLLATPCSAPFLGTAVGFALSQPASLTFIVFTAIGVGMAMPYIVIAAFPASVKWLPQPGQWMENLRGAMGFFLFAAAVWLMYVLSSQVSPEALAWIQLSFLGLAFLTWLGSTVRWESVQRVATVAVIVLFGWTVTYAGRSEVTPTTAETTTSSSELIDWQAFSEPRIDELVAAGNPVFVDVTADWCFTCKANERYVIETDEVASAFEEKGVIALKADWTNRNETIGRYLEKHGRYGIPFYILYRPGKEPHVFGELLTKEGLLSVVDTASPL